MKKSVKIASLILGMASFSLVAMDKVWEGRTLRQWAETYRNLEVTDLNQRYIALAMAQAQHPRLGSESPVSAIDAAVCQEICQLLTPTVEAFTYLNHPTQGPIKVICPGCTIGELKAHLRTVLGLPANAAIGIVYCGMHMVNDDPCSGTSGLLGTPVRPYQLIF